jgi:hypothetical protein
MVGIILLPSLRQLVANSFRYGMADMGKASMEAEKRRMAKMEREEVK